MSNLRSRANRSRSNTARLKADALLAAYRREVPDQLTAKAMIKEYLKGAKLRRVIKNDGVETELVEVPLEATWPPAVLKRAMHRRLVIATMLMNGAAESYEMGRIDPDAYLALLAIADGLHKQASEFEVLRGEAERRLKGRKAPNVLLAQGPIQPHDFSSR